jgi:acyl-CoA synthetase (AMP-forming)/AMP-acid ligase II
MGKAIPDTEIYVVNEKGELCKPNEIGELVHRGPTVSLGYWGKPQETEKVVRPNPFNSVYAATGERVCYSGDLVKTDEEGYLYFVGRRDGLIKCSGHRISPSEVEALLYGIGRIREVAVIGVPDEMAGQVIKAYVVPKEKDKFRISDLLEACAQRMPRYMIPREIVVLESFPKSVNGKIDYEGLRRSKGE